MGPDDVRVIATRDRFETHGPGVGHQITAHGHQITAHGHQITAHGHQITAHGHQITAHEFAFIC